MCVVKLDGQFQVQWSKVLQSSDGHLDYAIDAVPTPDGGFALLGAYDTQPWSSPVLAKLDYALLKFDAQGALQWAKRYGGSRTDLPYALHITPDSGFLLSGYTSQGTDLLGNPNPLILKLDAAGNVIWSAWQRNFTYNLAFALLAHPSFQMKAIPTQDGGYFYAISSGEWGYFVKLDAAGGIVWQQQCPMGGAIMGGEAQSLWGAAATGGFIADIEELPNGDLAVLGNVFYLILIGQGQNGGGIYIPVAFIARMSAAGQVQQASAFFYLNGQPGNATNLYASDFAALPNGRFLVTGSIGGSQVFMMEYDPSLTGLNQSSLWCRTYGYMNAAGYPYDYDVPTLALSHQGDYLSLYDNFFLHTIDHTAPTADACSYPLQVSSFPFNPALSAASVTLDPLNASASAAFQSQPLAVADTALCAGTAQSRQDDLRALALRVYPNPASEEVQIEAPFAAPAYAELRLLDAAGRCLRQETRLVQPGVPLRLRVAGLPPGWYLVRIQGEREAAAAPLTITR
jgi:hypothetical protein